MKYFPLIALLLCACGPQDLGIPDPGSSSNETITTDPVVVVSPSPSPSPIPTHTYKMVATVTSPLGSDDAQFRGDILIYGTPSSEVCFVPSCGNSFLFRVKGSVTTIQTTAEEGIRVDFYLLKGNGSSTSSVDVVVYQDNVPIQSFSVSTNNADHTYTFQ